MSTTWRIPKSLPRLYISGGPLRPHDKRHTIMNEPNTSFERIDNGGIIQRWLLQVQTMIYLQGRYYSYPKPAHLFISLVFKNS